ncbi:MAG: RNA polymerase sigma factor [Bryobacteraceae bacterium]|nr:RNA polymerase sigma factor [Bryobacteraceae bacterium]
MSDQQLVSAMLRRDRKAAAEFVERHSGAVYNYVRRRLSPRIDMVDDLVQEVFLAAWSRLVDYRGDAEPRAWLLGIARHKVEDHYRARLRSKMDQEDEDSPIEATPAPDPPLDFWLDQARVEDRTQRILASLPEHYSAVLQWRYWEKRSVQEMAAALGRTEKAVERTLARAREQFKLRWSHE